MPSVPPETTTVLGSLDRVISRGSGMCLIVAIPVSARKNAHLVALRTPVCPPSLLFRYLTGVLSPAAHTPPDRRHGARAPRPARPHSPARIRRQPHGGPVLTTRTRQGRTGRRHVPAAPATADPRPTRRRGAATRHRRGGRGLGAAPAHRLPGRQPADPRGRAARRGDGGGDQQGPRRRGHAVRGATPAGPARREPGALRGVPGRTAQGRRTAGPAGGSADHSGLLDGRAAVARRRVRRAARAAALGRRADLRRAPDEKHRDDQRHAGVVGVQRCRRHRLLRAGAHRQPDPGGALGRTAAA